MMDQNGEDVPSLHAIDILKIDLHEQVSKCGPTNQVTIEENSKWVTIEFIDDASIISSANNNEDLCRDTQKVITGFNNYYDPICLKINV